MRSFHTALALAALLAVLSPAAAQPPTPQPVQPPAQDFPMPRALSLTVQNAQEKQRILAARPRSPENDLASGVLRALSKQYPEAIQNLASVKAELPAMAGWGALFSGFAKYRLGDYQGALADLDAVSGSQAAIFPDALLLSAYCLEALGSPEALARHERFLALANQPLRPASLWRAGAIAAAAGRFPQAQAYLSELILQNPWTASAEKADPLARELAKAGKTTFDPDSAESLRQRIEVLLDRSQSAKAQPLIDRYAAKPGSDQARALYLKGKLLYAKRDTQAAIQHFEDAARLASDPLLAAWALYHQGRAYWRLSSPEDASRMAELLGGALARSRTLPKGADLTEASRRLLMLLDVERGNFADALPLAEALAASGPEPTEAREQAAWLAGLIRFALSDYDGARAALGAYLQRFPDSGYAPAAHYWTGRARLAAGDTAGARDAFGFTAMRWPNGYYGMLAATRLTGDAAPASSGAASPAASSPNPAAPGIPDQTPGGPALAGQSPASAALASLARSTPPAPAPSIALPTSGPMQAGAIAQPTGAAMQAGASPEACPDMAALPVPDEAAASLERAAILEAGLLPELAERELSALHAAMPGDQAAALRYAMAATSLGNHQAAVRAVTRAFRTCLDRGTRQGLLPIREIVYPDRFRDLIEKNLAGSGVDVNIIRGLIRQESFFEPEAVSGAGAVGLMQVLPSTAKSLAEKLGDKGFRADALKDPAVNVRFGVRYFLERHAEYGGNLALTLASYNAGRVKIGVWREFLGGLDQELFVEFIPYTETRDYVKKILGNRAMYALLY
jgi:soluble lytic murein transglycosylase